MYNCLNKKLCQLNLSLFLGRKIWNEVKMVKFNQYFRMDYDLKKKLDTGYIISL